jgi:hypothetical protein
VARPQFRIRQTVDLADDDGPVIVQEAQQQFFRIAKLAPGLMHDGAHASSLRVIRGA